jgi:phosphoribosylformylglycinamidine synthase
VERYNKVVKKAIVLKAPGTNNDYEAHHSLESAGAETEVVHINELASGKKNLRDYAIAVIPGGFSYGDDLGAGKVFSLFLEYRLRESFSEFIRQGRIVLGICNGFQVLVKSKLLPDLQEKQTVTLGFNDSGRFVCKWVKLRIRKNLFWFRGMPEEIEMPVAHAEGKFMSSPEAIEKLDRNGQVALSYIENPNGSEYDIAGITNPHGNVLGLMPHPDRCCYSFQHPGSRMVQVNPWGKIFFENIIKNA